MQALAECSVGESQRWSGLEDRYLQLQVADEADDAKSHKQNVGQGEGIDGIGELLDLMVAWSADLGGSPISGKHRQSLAALRNSPEAPLFLCLALPHAGVPAASKATKAENHFSVSRDGLVGEVLALQT